MSIVKLDRIHLHTEWTKLKKKKPIGLMSVSDINRFGINVRFGNQACFSGITTSVPLGAQISGAQRAVDAAMSHYDIISICRSRLD